MTGNETTRFCSYCQKQVHNLAALSASERLALLAAPAASVCARYQVALRRPAKGKEQSYHRHLLKYGAGVALAGSVLVVLWEMQAENEKRIFYRAALGRDGRGCEMSSDYYREHLGVTLGMVVQVPEEDDENDLHPVEPVEEPRHIDLNLDPAEMDKLLNQIRPPPPPPPVKLQTG